MKKTISIFCTIALLLSVCTVFTTFPTSAETEKYVSGNVILPNGTATELKTFTYEDFEYETTDVFSTPYISKYVSDDVKFLGDKPAIQTDSDLGSKGMYVSTSGSCQGFGTRQAAISVNPEYWQKGNKVTEFSFDATNVSSAQIPVFFLWAKELDVQGYTTGTGIDSGVVLGDGMILGVGYGEPSAIVSSFINNNMATNGGYHPEIYKNDTDPGLDAHFEISVKYTDVTSVGFKANYSLTVYRYNATGDYGEDNLLSKTDYSTVYDCSSIDGLTAEDLTLVPMINPAINIGNTVFDNISVKSVDTQVLSYLKTYSTVFESGNEDEWKNASLALSSLPVFVQKRLGHYSGIINRHYADTERMITDDFTDGFKSSMFWSNFGNLKIENNSVVGTNDSDIISVADGALTKGKALSAVYLKNVQGFKSTYDVAVKATVTSLYPLYCGTSNPAVSAPMYLYDINSENNIRIEPHGGLEVWENICTESDDGNFAFTLGSNKMTDVDIAVFYDWSDYNAENNYKIQVTYCVKYKINGTGDYQYAYRVKPLHLGTAVKDGSNMFVSSDVSAFTEIPKPEDFKFAMRNIGSVDSVSILTTDEISGAVSNTGIYFKADDRNDSNNGALVYTLKNQTFADSELAEVVDYGAIFINKATLTAQGKTTDDLSLTTDKVMKLSTKESGLGTDVPYNVRINGTQDEKWAAEKIAARTYVTYKFGTSIRTVYGDVTVLSNMANLKTVAGNNGVDLTGKTFAQAMAAVSDKRYN